MIYKQFKKKNKLTQILQNRHPPTKDKQQKTLIFTTIMKIIFKNNK